jgi:hypothetical protein
MNIAELFVSLGVKGSEKTLGALGGIRKGLGEVSSMSLEAKAGILAAVYGFERLMSASAAVGTGLVNFNALTGLSAKQLQQWQFAARQAGESSEEFTGSLKAVQNSMSNMLLGKGAPEGMALVAKATKDFDPTRVRDTFYVMQQLQKAAQLLPKDLGNQALKSFGISDATIAAMGRNAFRPEVLSKAPTYGDREIGQLDKANIAWSNLGNKIEMAFGHFNASHGAQLVQDLSKVTDQVIKLVEAFQKLADKIKLFDWIGKVFEGWSLIFSGAAKGVDAISGAVSDPKKREQVGSDVVGFFKEMPGVFKAMLDDISPETKDKFKNILYGDTPFYRSLEGPTKSVLGQAPQTVSPDLQAQMIAPPMGPTPPASGSTQNINVNQNLNFQHEGKEHQKTSDSVKKAVQDSYRKMAAQGQGA